jgi:hypothetical protein
MWDKEVAEWKSGRGNGKVLNWRPANQCAFQKPAVIGRPTETVIEIATQAHLGSPHCLQLAKLTRHCYYTRLIVS